MCRPEPMPASSSRTRRLTRRRVSSSCWSSTSTCSPATTRPTWWQKRSLSSASPRTKSSRGGSAQTMMSSAAIRCPLVISWSGNGWFSNSRVPFATRPWGWSARWSRFWVRWHILWNSWITPPPQPTSRSSGVRLPPSNLLASSLSLIVFFSFPGVYPNKKRWVTPTRPGRASQFLFSELSSFQNGALSPVAPPAAAPGTSSPSSAGSPSSLVSKSPARCKEDMNISPRSSTPRSSFFPSWFMTPILAPINLFGSGKLGKKGDKDKESETEMAGEVVDASTIQHDTKERVHFSKLLLVWVVRLIWGYNNHFWVLQAYVFLDFLLFVSRHFIWDFS